MKRFLLFSSATYDQLGGWKDFIGDFETLEVAIAAGKAEVTEPSWTWWHVVDLASGKIVARS